MTTRLALILGIRPDVIRAAEIIKLLDESSSVELIFIWSGQHYSENLKDIFFKELNVRNPDYELGVKGNNDSEIVSQIIIRLYDILSEIKPEAVIFLGDTNTVAGCIAAAQLNIPILHIEGCMRSYDWRMPEEKYRTLIDHLSDVIYAYLPDYKENGILEGIDENKIILTQNPIVDILNKYYQKKDMHDYLEKYSLKNKNFVLMTCHRRENVEDVDSLTKILNLCNQINYPILFPASYRTQQNIKKFALRLPSNIILIDPIGYMDFINLLDISLFTLTDSGTVVEEACIIGIPSMQIRKSTERPEVYKVKSSIKFDPTINYNLKEIKDKISKVINLSGTKWENPFGDGKASKRIANDIIMRANEKKFRTHNFDKSKKNVLRALTDEGY